MSTSSIPLDHPALNTPQPDYTAVVEGPHGLEIALRYRTLSHTQQRYVLALWRAGEPTLAQRAAGCYRSGTLFQICPRGAYARGYKHRCGDPFCVTCSRARIRFYAWAAKRDHAKFRVPCVGVELFINDRPDVGRDGLVWAATNFIRDVVCPDALMSDAFGASGDLSVRCVVPLASVNRKDLQWWWHDGGKKLSVKYGDPIELYLWAFSGMLGAACMAAEDKAALRISLKKARLVRTIGTFYAPLSKEELVARDAAEPHSPATCPVCKDHQLETLAMEQRHEESVESAEARYDSVDWTSEKEDLFLIRRGNLTDNSKVVGESTPIGHESDHPPPS